MFQSISEESDLTVLQFSDTEGTKYVASVSCLSDETTDRAIAEDLAKFLEDNKKPVVRREYKRGKLPELDDARWNIFIISKNSFGVGDNVLDIELASALCRCGDNKHIQMIPVVNGMKIDDVPKSLKWATMLGTEQENYKEIILRQIEGRVCFSVPVVLSLIINCPSWFASRQPYGTFFIPPQTFFVVGYTVFTLSVHVSVRDTLFFFLISRKRSDGHSSNSSNSLISIRCTYIRKSKGAGPILLESLPFVKFLNAVKVCVHTISLTDGGNLTKLAQIHH